MDGGSALNRETGIPEPKILKFFRECDSRGNFYFLTEEDSRLMADSDSLYFDGTFSPIKGCSFFEQLYIIGTREKLRDGNIRVHPCCYVYMVDRTYENYKCVFLKIKEIVNGDLDNP